MKKVYALMFALFLVNGVMGQWFPVNQGIPGGNCVFFIDANTGYVDGWLKTTDGGTSWTQNLGLPMNCMSMYFTSVDTGYAAGLNKPDYTEGYICKTTDGGINWTTLLNPGGSSAYSSIYFTGIDTGYSVGFDMSGSQILKTTDGGLNWTPYYTPGYQPELVFFPTTDTGYVVGYDPYPHCSILQTANGGADWTMQGPIIPSGEISSVYFSDAKTGYVVGTDFSQGIILKTVDEGINWTCQNFSDADVLTSVFFLDENTGYAIGYEDCSWYHNGIILVTTDGGVNWTNQFLGLSYALYAIFFPTYDTGYIVGDNIILKTTNGGFQVGIEYFNTNTFLLNVYPNPASTTITIETPSSGQLSILNLNGQQLITSQIKEAKTVVDINNFPSGIFVVKVVGEKGVQVGKVVKQ